MRFKIGFHVKYDRRYGSCSVNLSCNHGHYRRDRYDRGRTG
jgi:hypothetical protein